MIALVQFLIKYALLEPFGVQVSLDLLGITLLVIATVCIAAAGNIINDINDIEIDFINKPNKIIIGKSISEKTAYNLFILFNLLGVGVGFYLSHSINRAPFFSIFVIISILLYIYSTYLKSIILIGNIIISVLVALSIIIVGVFELLPSISSLNQHTQLIFFKVILNYGLFAFTINLLREIIKDIEDIDGDYKAGLNTLPIVVGRTRAKYILSVLNFIPLVAIIHYIISDLYRQPLAVIYFLIFIIAPLIYIIIKTYGATSKKDMHHISTMYKLVMLFGMLSLLLYKYIILK